MNHKIIKHQTSNMASSTASTTYNKKTYRHEFSKAFMTELSRFSKVHQYDDRITYKSEWQKWTNNEEIAQSMETEKRRLQENGYIGDIDDKMFKAGRYYFRKKTTTTILNNHKEDEDEDEEEPSSTPSTPKDARISETQAATTTTTTTTTTTERRTYITMSKQCIQMMDEHIQESAAASASSSSPFKPSICYTNFYETKMTSDEMTKEIGNIVEKYEKTISANSSNRTEDELTQEIMDKIKKTYKNRYYKYISKTTTTRTKDNNDNDNDNDSK